MTGIAPRRLGPFPRVPYWEHFALADDVSAALDELGKDLQREREQQPGRETVQRRGEQRADVALASVAPGVVPPQLVCHGLDTELG